MAKKKSTKKAESSAAIKKPPKLTPSAMKKKAARAAQWKGEARDVSRSILFSKMVEENSKDTGQPDMWVCGPDSRVHVGLPLPSFCLEYLLDSRIFPLTYMTQIFGKYGTGKSSLFAEIVRWFYEYGGGGGFLGENESKISVSLINSILQYVEGVLMISRTNSVEQWQQYLTMRTKEVQAFCDGTAKEPGPGRLLPCVFGVDSVVGKLAEDSIKAMDKEGAAARGHPVEALYISRWLKTYMSSLQGWPFHFVAVNQLDLKSVQGTSAFERVLGGGKQLGFLASIMLELKSEGHHRRVGERGLNVRMTCVKNSLGESQRSFSVTFKWTKSKDVWTDASGKECTGVRQYSWWDWDEASTQLLFQLTGSGAATKRFIENDLGMKQTKVRQSDGAWSKRLGHKSEKDALTYSEFGKQLCSDPDIMAEIRDHFGIQQGYLFDPEEDYLTQVREAVRTSTTKEMERTKRLLEGGDLDKAVESSKDRYGELSKGGLRRRSATKKKTTARKKKAPVKKKTTTRKKPSRGADME